MEKLTINHKKKTLTIFYEEDRMNPREDDCATIMICFHKKYILGDKHAFNFKNYSNWNAMKRDIHKKENGFLLKPLYMYDHSGITIATKPFSCPWDSGQIGFIMLKRSEAATLTKSQKERLVNSEIEIYNQYLSGEVYMFTVTSPDGDEIDSCGGFYGDNFLTNGMIDYIEDIDLRETLKKQLT